MSKAKNANYWLTTTELAARYGVSVAMLSQWRRYRGFPEEAAIRRGPFLMWDERPVDEWLAARPAPKRGPPPRWREIVDAAAR